MNFLKTPKHHKNAPKFESELRVLPENVLVNFTVNLWVSDRTASRHGGRELDITRKEKKLKMDERDLHSEKTIVQSQFTANLSGNLPIKILKIG